MFRSCNNIQRTATFLSFTSPASVLFDDTYWARRRDTAFEKDAIRKMERQQQKAALKDLEKMKQAGEKVTLSILHYFKVTEDHSIELIAAEIGHLNQEIARLNSVLAEKIKDAHSEPTDDESK